MFYAVGIDASMTGLGLLAIPGDWGCDLRRVLRAPILGTVPEDGCYPARREKLCRDVVEWVGWLQRKRGADLQVFLEGGIISKDSASSVRSQERIAGAVEDALWRHLGIECRTVEQTTARVLLLGYLPAKDRKQHVIDALSKLAPGWNPDHYDALAPANWAIRQEELPHLAALLPPKPPKPPKPKGRRAPKGQVAFA
jgi:hypothetical protein